MLEFKHLKCEVVDGATGAPLREWGIVEAGRRRDAKNMKYGIPAKKDHAPYHLLGTLRFDGREKVESQCFVHLDDEHEYFRETVLMKGCQVRGEDGNVRFHQWVFNEVGGIETRLDELSLELSGKEMSREDQLADLIDGLDPSDKSKAGSLEITFERVRVSSEMYWDFFKGEQSSRSTDKGDRAGKDVSLAAAAAEDGRKVDDLTNYMEFTPLGDPKPYAVFRFKYRSEDVLRQFEFEDFPEKVDIPDKFVGMMSLKEKNDKRRHESDSEDEENEEDTLPKSKRNAIEEERTDGDKTTTQYAGDFYDDSDDEEEPRIRAEMDEEVLNKWKAEQAKREADGEDSHEESTENRPSVFATPKDDPTAKEVETNDSDEEKQTEPKDEAKNKNKDKGKKKNKDKKKKKDKKKNEDKKKGVDKKKDEDEKKDDKTHMTLFKSFRTPVDDFYDEEEDDKEEEQDDDKGEDHAE